MGFRHAPSATRARSLAFNPTCHGDTVIFKFKSL